MRDIVMFLGAFVAVPAVPMAALVLLTHHLSKSAGHAWQKRFTLAASIAASVGMLTGVAYTLAPGLADALMDLPVRTPYHQIVLAGVAAGAVCCLSAVSCVAMVQWIGSQRSAV